MRRYNISDAYEQLKKLTRGQGINKERMKEFIENLDIPEEAKKRLIDLTPKQYTGLASALVKAFS